MKLIEDQIMQLEACLDAAAATVYPEPPSDLHNSLTAQILEHLWHHVVVLAPGSKVLDVGCGQGVALKHFVARGLDATGVTLSATDMHECTRQGFSAKQMDQSFLEFPEANFDMVWCRHCLEHSVFPFFTLRGFFRVLKPGGWLYVEVPAPDTSCNHQQNPNHYSVLGKSMWTELLRRTGFQLLEILDINFAVTAGPDTYWAFIARRSG